MKVTQLGMIPFSAGEYRFTREQWAALGAVADEMQRQCVKFPTNSHTPEAWNVILGEEFGEASKEVYTLTVSPVSEPGSINHRRNRYAYRDELSHVAAVAAAAIADELDRNGGA